jgi:hypothetical protein
MQIICETYLWLHEMTNIYDEVHKVIANQNLAQRPLAQGGHPHLAHPEPKATCRYLVVMYGDPPNMQRL